MAMWAADGRDVYHDEIFQNVAARGSGEFCRRHDAFAGESSDGIYNEYEYGRFYNEWNNSNRL